MLTAFVAGLKVHEVWVAAGDGDEPFDAADYSAWEADHNYTALEQDYRNLSVLMP